MTQKEHLGLDAADCLKSILAEFSTKKVFLVVDGDSYTCSGAEQCMARLLSDYEVESFCDFGKNPKIEDLCRGIELFDKAKSDVVIAIGGGSVIDMAKMINFFACNRLDPKTYVIEKKEGIKKGRPLIAIPTTSGTGSEATHFAVLYIGHEKVSIAHRYILPDVAIVDPQFTRSLPRGIAASSGMDALSQAIESYWCINSNPQSKEFAKEAILLILPNLVTAVNNPTDAARAAMSQAAHLAGKAINITKTTTPHAISYPLTSYFGIPHGHAVALTLSSTLVYNSQVSDDDVLDSRGCDYIRKTIGEIVNLLQAEDVYQAKERIDTLMHDIGLETRLMALNIKSSEDIELIIENGFNLERVKNNPRKLTENALREILLSIY